MTMWQQEQKHAFTEAQANIDKGTSVCIDVEFQCEEGVSRV